MYKISIIFFYVNLDSDNNLYIDERNKFAVQKNRNYTGRESAINRKLDDNTYPG